MDDAHDAETEPTPYMRLPWPLVAIGLLGVLAVVLAVGLFANRFLRPQVGLVPTPLAAAAAPPPATATPPPAVSTATPPTAISNAAPEPTSTPLAQVVVNPTATPAALTVAASPTPPSEASPTPSALPTVDPQLADEVGRAYVMFWRVRSQALLELDTSHLPEVMDGDYLANVSQRIEQLRAEGRAIKTQVTLNYSVVEVSVDSASVADNFKDNSIYVKFDTDEPLSSPTADQLNVLYRLRKFADVWKVVDSARSE